MWEQACEEPLHLCHLPLGAVAERRRRLGGRLPNQTSFEEVSVVWEECNSSLPPILLLTFSGGKRRSWTIFSYQGYRRQLLLCSGLASSQFGISPAVSIAEVAARPIICHHSVARQMVWDSEEELYPTCSRRSHLTRLTFYYWISNRMFGELLFTATSNKMSTISSLDSGVNHFVHPEVMALTFLFINSCL